MEPFLDQINAAADAQAHANRHRARLWAALAELLRLARTRPELYLRPAGLAQADWQALAEDAAAFDAGLHLHLSAGQVRTLAHRAQQLQARLPRLQAAFTAGSTGEQHAAAATELLAGWHDADAVAAFDAALAEAATTLTPEQFRRRARRLKESLLVEPAEARHARAAAARRVWVEPEDDGMAWLHLLLPAPDAIRIAERLDATARAEQKKTPVGDPGWRSRNQIRADLAAAWLAGDGTPTAARVRPVLLVPLLSLLGHGDEPALLRGYGPIDTASAAALFAAAPSFRRVATDPISGEKLRYDRTRYRPTQAQRDWLALRYEDCIDPTCTRPVADTDTDHLDEWARDHGSTNTENLVPLCPPGNRRKNLSWISYTRDTTGQPSIHTPTGLHIRIDTDEAAPF